MKITNIKTSLLGQSVPTNINGVAGRYIEEYMQQEGWPTDLRGAGADVPIYSLEIKSHDKDFSATNPGVWCHSLHDLMDRNTFTSWAEYTKDEVIK